MQSSSTISEHLLHLACQGDAHAQDQVLHHFTPIWSSRLRRAGIQRDDAEDILSKLYLSFLETAHKVVHPRAFFAFYEKRLNWLIQDHQRNAGRKSRILSLDAIEAPDSDARFDSSKMACMADEKLLPLSDLVCLQEQQQQVHSALAQLPPQQAETVKLVVLKGLTYEEVALRMQIPIGTVRSRLFLGRARLKQILTPLIN